MACGRPGAPCRGNTWFIPYETIQRRDRDRPHPATFPVRLPEQCLKLHGLSRIKTVLDPFLGLGSTAVACARLGVDFIGTEIDEDYLNEAADRIRNADATPRRAPARLKMKKAGLREEPAKSAASSRAS